MIRWLISRPSRLLVVAAVATGMLASACGNSAVAPAVPGSVGDCLPNGAEDAAEFFVPPDTVPCDEPHIGEIYGVVEYPQASADYPGSDAVVAAADASCFSLLFDYVGGAQTLIGAQFMELSPTEQTWGFGDRTILCLLISKETRTGTLRNAAAEFGFVSSFDIDPGTCFVANDILVEDHASPIDCDEAHSYEVLSRHLMEGTAFPGDDAVDTFAVAACEADPAIAVFGSDDVVTWLAPTDATWAVGDRTVFCVADLLPPREGSIAVP